MDIFMIFHKLFSFQNIFFDSLNLILIPRFILYFMTILSHKIGDKILHKLYEIPMTIC
jgi:hypothetical protein